MADADWFLVGKIVGFHGLAGELKVQPSTNAISLLEGIEDALLQLPDGQSTPARITKLSGSDRGLRMSFAEFPDRTSAEKLAGAAVLVRRSSLRPLPEDEFWIGDLSGLDAFTTDGAHIGRICSVIDGGNPLLEIAAGDSGKTVMVPFVRALVPLVDLGARRVEIREIPGLLEPQ